MADGSDDKARMDKWAKERGLRKAERAECLHWIAVGRCGVSYCQENRGPHMWMDHTTGWTKNGTRLMLCQPYHLSHDDLLDMVRVADRLNLKISVHGIGWYGHGTICIEIEPRVR